MSRQYVAVQFSPWDRRSYTFHDDEGGSYAAGDRVRVQTAKGEAEVTVLRSFVEPVPEFETKPILGRVLPPPHSSER